MFLALELTNKWSDQWAGLCKQEAYFALVRLPVNPAWLCAQCIVGLASNPRHPSLKD